MNLLRFPSWILMSINMVMLVGLFLLEMRRPYSAEAHRIIQMGILFLMVRSGLFWIQIDDRKLDRPESSAAGLNGYRITFDDSVEARSE
jgi:hypothetical protein